MGSTSNLMDALGNLNFGDHLCLIYRNRQEQLAAVIPFIKHGLERGEKCLYIVDEGTAQEVRDALQREGVDVQGCLDSGQLSILTKEDAYVKEGCFDPDKMIALLAESTEAAVKEGYPGLRVTGEMTWALQGLPGSERLIEYEAKLNEFFPSSKCLAVCQYDQQRLDPAVLLDVLRTHPIAVVGAVVYDNFYYIPPAELLGGELPAAELRYCLQNLAERQRAEGEIKRRTVQLEALREVGLELTAQLDLDTLLSYIVSRAVELVGGNSGGLYLYRPERDVLEWAMAVGPHLAPIGTVLRRGEGLSGKVWESGEPLIVDDYQAWEGRAAVYEGYPFGAVVGVPVRWGEELLGVLNVLADPPHTLSPADVELLSLFAQQAAIAIKNAKLYGEAQWKSQELARLSEASQAVTSSLDLEDVLAKIVSLAGRVANSAATSVDLVEDGELGASFEDFRDIPPLHVRARPHGFTRRIIATGEPVVTDEIFEDGSTEPPIVGDEGPIKANPELVKAGIKSLAGLPITAKGKVVGVLFVHNFQPHVFKDKLPLLTAFANQAAIAIENARLFEEEKRRATQLALINEVAEKAASILDLDRLMQEVTHSIQEKFNYYNVALFLLDEERREVVMQAMAGGFETKVTGEYRQSLDDGIIGFVTRTGRSWLANDVSEDPYYIKAFWEVLTKSELCVPIKLSDKGSPEGLRRERSAERSPRGVIGALDVQSTHLYDFNQSDVTAMEAVADQLAIAIENARLYGETRRHARQLKALTETGLAVSSTLSLDEVLQVTLEQLGQVVPYDTVSLWLREGGVMRIHAVRGFEAPEEHIGLTIAIPDDPLSQEILHTLQPLVIADAQQDERFRGLAGTGWVRSWLGVPLLSKGEAIGLLTINKKEPGLYTATMAELALAFANQAAIAIEKARLFEETRRRLAREERLNELAHTLGGEMELATIIPRLLPLVIELTGADAGTVAVLDPERQVTTYPYHHNLPDSLASIEVPATAGLAGHTMTIRQPVLLDDYREHPAALQPWVEAGVRSVLGVPLLAGDEVVGALGLCSLEEVRPFGSETVAAAEAAGRLAAVAIQRARLYEETCQRAIQLQTIEEVGRRVSSILDLDELLPYVAKAIQQSFGYYHVDVFLVDQATGYAVFKASSDPAIEKVWKEQGFRLKVGEEGMIGWVAHTGEPLLANDVSQEPHYLPDELLPETKSELAVPLKVEERVVGVLDVESDELNAFDEEDIFILNTLAGQVAIAIENARLFKDVQRRVQELADLNEASQVITSSLHLEDVLTRIISLAGRVFDSAATSVVLVEDGNLGLSIENLRGIPSISHRARPHGMTRQIIATGEPMVINEILSDGATEPPIAGDKGPIKANPALLEVGIKSLAGIPIISKGKVSGVLFVHSVYPYTFKGLLPFLTAFANQIAIAIENARLFEEARRRLRELESLAQASAAITSTLELHPRLENILSAAMAVVPAAEKGSILLLDEATGELAIQTLIGYTDPRIRSARFPREAGYSAKAVREGRSLLIPDARADPSIRYDGEIEEMRAILSAAVIPLRVKGRVIGAISLDNASRRATFSEDDLRLLTAFADQAAIAIENARLYEAAQQELAERKRAEQLLQALNQAAIAMERALTPEEIFTAVAAELKKLGFSCIVFLLDEGQKRLFGKYWSYETAMIKAAEKLTGFKVENVPIPVETSGVYGKAVSERKTVFVENVEDVTRQMLPESVKKFTRQIISTLKIPKSIAAPLIVEDKAIGLLSVQSDDLTEDDIPAITAFAHQMAAAWRKAQLLQDLKGSLEELKQTQAQLIQSGKLAAIGQLVAGVAHELNNPLTSVVGYSQLLLSAECGEEIKRDLERISRQAQRAAEIVHNLLTFARRREPRKEPININDVIEKSLELQAHQLELDRISIVRELDKALPPTMADPFQMQQVFMNIITNAYQALRDWEGKRELRVRSRLEGDMIRLEFADSGPGIPPEVMSRLFEPFFTTREVGEGTGLGLPISHGIVEAHGGRIWAESPSTELGTGEVGKGATFIVEIPAKGD